MHKLIQASVFAAIGVLVFASLLIPVVDDATATTDTFKNEGAYFVEVDPSTTYTLKYQQYADPGKIIVNGTELPISFNQGYTLLNLDNTILRLVANGQMHLFGEGSEISDIANVDITISNGTVIGTLGQGNPINTIPWPKSTYTDAFIISPTDGGSVMKSYTTPAKVNAETQLKAYGVTVIHGATDSTILVEVEGSIKDGVDVTLRNLQTSVEISSMTISNLQINYTVVDGYVDLYDLTSITFTVTNGEYTTDVTYSAFVVPSTVTAERTIHADEPTREVLETMPLILIAGLIIGVLGYAVYSRIE